MWDLLTLASDPFVRETMGALIALGALGLVGIFAPRRRGAGMVLSMLGLLSLLGSFLLGASSVIQPSPVPQIVSPESPYFVPVLTCLRYYLGLPLLLAGVVMQVGFTKRLITTTHNAIAESRRRVGTLRESNFELAQRAQKMREMNERLRQIQEEKDSLLSSVSHELKTPLTSIQAFSEILLEYEDAEASVKREFTQVIHREAERLSRLVNDLLDLAKIEAGALRLKLSLVDLPELVGDVVRSLSPLAEAKEVRIESSVEGDLPHVEGDRDRLQQVLTNLVSNAIKFGRGRSAVNVHSRFLEDEEMVEVRVRDEGPGIPENELEHIFDRFRRGGEGGADGPEGTGLGLAICREIVNLHGGRIWGRSREGEGSTFFFTVRACAGGKDHVREVPAEPSTTASGG